MSSLGIELCMDETLRKNLEEIIRSDAIDIEEYKDFLNSEGIEVDDEQVDKR